jgi:ParB family chromosome partitioning protein
LINPSRLDNGVNALWEPVSRYDGRVSAHGVARRLEHSHVLARAVGLDMVSAGWKPTVDNYLGRVTKARILAAVEEAGGAPAAARIDGLKKVEMAQAAERLLDGSSWLAEPLRTPELPPVVETAMIGGERHVGEETPQADNDDADTDDVIAAE